MIASEVASKPADAAAANKRGSQFTIHMAKPKINALTAKPSHHDLGPPGSRAAASAHNRPVPALNRTAAAPTTIVTGTVAAQRSSMPRSLNLVQPPSSSPATTPSTTPPGQVCAPVT